ncbi:MAG: SPOR domain-containing protein [Betaproteobacteria bacterium]|nr:SPOR domain-containing protein [Betaproteobacteria bacterium]
MSDRTFPCRRQAGGTLLGVIIGLLVGLGIALAVAIYVTKVPVPFMQKVIPASQIKPEDEAKRNQGWNANAPLASKNPGAKDGTAPAPEAPASAPAARPPAAPGARNGAAAGTPDPIGQFAKAEAPPARARDAAGAKPGDPWVYFLQAGAFRDADQAEQQRAKLAMLGIETKVTERDQSGAAMYRVRLGPFSTLDDINQAKARLDSQGIETAIVRMPR